MENPNASLISNKSNIRYLSNFTGSSGFMLLTKKKNYLFTDFRYIQRAKNTLKRGIQIIDIKKMWKNPEELKKNWHRILKKHQIKSIGIEETAITIAQFKKFKKISRIPNHKIKFIDISGNIEKIREKKNRNEIRSIKISQKINEKVFKEIERIIKDHIKNKKATLTEIDLVWKIKELGHKFGAEDTAFDPIVAFGKHTASPHHLPDKTKLKKDDIILIDMGMKYNGYCSDMTRIIFASKPTKKQKEIYNLVLKAQSTGIKALKANIKGQQVDKKIRDIIEKSGYGENFGHASGHGLGLDIHEKPSLSDDYKDTLKERSIVTVEPGIYIENEFGIRIEDMVLLEQKGNKNITKIKKKI